MSINKCLIIEERDEKYTQTEECFKALKNSSVCYRSKSYKEAMKIMMNNNMDLILADTGSIGHEELKDLSHAVYPQIPIIALSDSPLEAVKSYEMGVCVDFILRPFESERMLTAIHRVLKYQTTFLKISEGNDLFLKTGRSFTKFTLDDIIFIEAYGTYTKIYTNKGKFIANDSLSKLEERLLLNNFIRVHKSFIVNTKKVVSFDASNFILELGKVPIGRNYKNRLEGLVNMYSVSTGSVLA